MEMDDSGRISATIETHISDSGQISITTPLVQHTETYLICGDLTQSDMRADYHSDASEPPLSNIIANPLTAYQNSDRALFGRIQSISRTGFFLSALPSQPVVGPVEISLTFDITQFSSTNGTTEPRLLAYCTLEHIWIDASESCQNSSSVVDWQESTLVVSICNLQAHCLGITNHHIRRRRQNDEETTDEFVGSHSFALASVDTEFINHAPILWSDTHYETTEDPGLMVIALEGRDPENDTFEFVLSENSTHFGFADLTSDGILTYRPCGDCFGNDLITLFLIEIRHDDIEPLQSMSMLNISIVPLNDHPRLIAMRDGDSLSDDDYRITIVIEEYAPQKNDYTPLEILLGAYDVDGNGVNIYYRSVDSGEVVIENQVETHQYSHQNCSIPWEARETTWHNLEHDIRENSPGIVMIIPCDMPEDVTGKTLQWTLSLVKYVPEIGYYGTDTLLVNDLD